MFQVSLYQSVESFAALTYSLPDSALDAEWAWGAYDSEGVRFAFFRTYEELRELAVRVVTERMVHGPRLTTAQRILAQYHAAYRDLQATMLGLDAEAAERSPAEEEWPVRQVLKHIVLANLGFYGLTKYALERHRSGDGRPSEIPEEAWDQLLGEDESMTGAALDAPLVDLQAYHQAWHDRVVNEFANVSEDELALPAMYWEGYELSLRFRLHRFDSHLRQHTIQIAKTLVRTDRAPSEAQRLLRLIYAALAEAEGATIGAWELGAEHREETAAAITARTDEISTILNT